LSQVIADSREYRTDVIKYIKEAGCQVVQRQLEIGDYIAGHFLFERKSAHDFISSIVDGRLFDQAARLLSSGQRPVIIIEGDLWRAADMREVHQNAILGAELAIARMGVGMLYTRSPEQTGHAICLAARQAEREDRGIRIPHTKGADLRKLQIEFLSSLPGVGIKTAEQLLKKYGSPLKAIQNYRSWPLPDKALARIRRVLEGLQEDNETDLSAFF
jgi:DNA excision repair protein ERCC-4